MIDFTNGKLFKLRPLDPQALNKDVGPILISGEEVIASFQALRDKVVFTTKRVIALNVQGITGKKIDYTSLPYARVQAFSVETAGNFDLDCEIDLMFSGVTGYVRFEIVGTFDIKRFSKLLAERIL